jgi:hypothetical protein
VREATTGFGLKGRHLRYTFFGVLTF